MIKVKGDGYWVLLCDCGIKGCKVDKFLICGVYASKKEAQEVNKSIGNCLGRHYIKKCKVEVILK